ncbi:MAG: hypothetical protein KF742_04140 [Cryobacterium sp.]|nr:hypothetical protein [Cryobacterium sp.]MCO5293413.1 hypothetical protein [Homoserinimonas sp.]
MRENRRAETREKVGTLRAFTRPWTLMLLFTGGFQVGRGAPIDGVFFLAIAALLIVDEFRPITLPMLALPRNAILVGIAAVLAIAMILAPRHGIVEGVIVSGIGLTVLLIAWPNHESASSSGLSIRRAGILWSVIALTACIIEVVSFLIGVPSDAARYAHPSVSLLLDPALDTIEGRVVFTVLWLVVGIALIRRGKR